MPADGLDIVIVGAGGHGRVVLEAVRAEGRHAVVGFVDADEQLADVAGVPVVGQAKHLARLRAGGVGGAIVAIGDNRVRAGYFAALLAAGLEPVTVVHPAATVSPSASLGRGTFVSAAAVVAAEAAVGDNSIVNTAAVVEHEARVGPDCHVAPAASFGGRVTLGAGAFVGLNATVLPCLNVGAGATVGAGAVLTRDVPAGQVWAGCPARPLAGT